MINLLAPWSVRRGLACCCGHLLLLLCLSILTGYAQSDREMILKLRKDSNEALKAFDHAQFLSYLTDDVQITTGNGILLRGKKSSGAT